MERTCDHCRPEEIVRLVKANDSQALDRITRCYGNHLLAVGERVCGDRESARDAVQDALLAAGEHLESFRGDGSVEGWLVTMVANACRTRRRGRKNQPAWNAELDAERTHGTGEPPDEGAAHAELSSVLRGALLALTPADRALVLLTQVDGWTAPEVGAALDLSAEAVRARLTRVRRRLRDELSAVWADWSDG